MSPSGQRQQRQDGSQTGIKFVEKYHSPYQFKHSIQAHNKEYKLFARFSECLCLLMERLVSLELNIPPLNISIRN